MHKIRVEKEQSAAYILALYRWLLQDNAFAQLWSCTGADGAIIEAIAAGMQAHIKQWNTANAVKTGVEWITKDDGEGWLGLEPALEAAEFNFLAALWDLSQASAGDDDATFFTKATAITQKSILFTLLRDMRVTRTDGSTKEVWPHIAHVVSNLHSEALRVMPPYGTAQERQAIVRFIAFVHDLFNVVAIDNDWLQLHAHGGAAFIYRFLVTKMQMKPVQATSIVRVIDLHHVLQLQKIDGLTGRDRVIEPESLASFFAKIPNGLEELGRLIVFALADTSQRKDFQSEHIIASLGLIDIFLNMQPEMNYTKRAAVATLA